MINKQNQAFTLIELSIVLVIIGLIAGGVLVGRDLIDAAQLRSQIAQLEKLETAIFAFRDKYRCLPGDCADAESFGLIEAGGDGDNGNGNGIIGDSDPVTLFSPTQTEILNLWYHMGKSGLLGAEYPFGIVPGINSPPLKYEGNGMQGFSRGGIWYIRDFDLNNQGDYLGSQWMLATIIDSIPANIPGVYFAGKAFRLDSKLDDGLPFSGNVSAVNNWTAVSCVGTVPCFNVPVFAPTSCLTGGLGDSGRYNTRSTRASSMESPEAYCMMLIKSKI